MRQAPIPPETDDQKSWFHDGEDADAQGEYVIVQPDTWSDDHWYWYERGKVERSRLYADALEGV